MSEERKVLSRWSERKAAARRGEAPTEPVDATPPVTGASPTPQDASPAVATDQALPADAAPSDEEMLALPSIDELNAESDYTVFLGERVPEQLRRAALRKLWTSDPVLANLDGLNDYDEDYNLVKTVVGAVQSAWRVGRGYAEEVEEKLDRVEGALGSSTDSEEQSQSRELQQSESRSVSETARVSQNQDNDALSENDAAGDNSADAPRQVASAVPDPKPAHPHEDTSEASGSGQ